MMKRCLLTGLVAMAAMICVNAQTTQKLTAAKHNEYGLIYSLPTTHLNIEVEAERTVKKAGPYYRYAKKYLGTTDVVTSDSETWDLKSVDITSYGVANKDKEYLMQFKNGATTFVMLSEKGLPLSINTENVIEPETTKKEVKREKGIFDDNKFGTVMSGELLMSGSTAKKAEVAANQIYKIRESRTNYITGEADYMPDGNAMKLIMKELDNQEAALVALFVGITQTETLVANFDYVPREDVNDEVVFRLSDFNGLVEKNDLSGEPVYITVKTTKRGELPLTEKGEERKLPKGAVMYNIPGEAQVSLKYEGKQIFSKRFDVSQFGVDFGLNPSMFTEKKSPSYIKFYPQTGGIMELGTVTTE